MIKYETAHDVEHFARELMGEHVTTFGWLINQKIVYVYHREEDKDGDPKDWTSAGKVVLGMARKVTGLNAFLTQGPGEFGEDDERGDPYFVIEINRYRWSTMDDRQRKALVDHELMHLGRDEEGKLSIVPHDLEDFLGTYQRHGAWRHDVKRWETACRQLSLLDQEAKEPAAA